MISQRQLPATVFKPDGRQVMAGQRLSRAKCRFTDPMRSVINVNNRAKRTSAPEFDDDPQLAKLGRVHLDGIFGR